MTAKSETVETPMRDFHLPGRSAVFAANGMCATSHPLSAKVAVETLQAGGNAVDAAIAGAALLGICEPHMAGIGGDCFALIKPAGEERIVALNGSGRAPAGLSAASMREAGHQSVPVNGPEAVTVPGAVDAFCTLSADYGRLGLEAALAPAILYAEAGVPTAPRVAFDWAHSAATLRGVARGYYTCDGRSPKAGVMFRHPRQADVFRSIARNGRSGFYEGEVAEDMVNSLRALGGTHGLDDFARTQCEYTKPVSGKYGDIELLEHPPNTQGATALLLLNILAEFDVAAMEPFGAMRAHIEAEATKLAYDARNRFIADSDSSIRLDHMLDPETAKRLAALIDPGSAMPPTADIAEAVHRDTVYITVVDRERMAVSLIYSLFHSFGAGIASERFGILFHNRGAGFTLAGGHPNEAMAGKRPMHTIIPAILKRNDRVLMPFGVMGGQYQACGHVRFVTNLVDFGLDLQSAIDAPRSFSDGGDLQVENGYSDSALSGLTELGHRIVRPETAIGGAQAIRMDHDLGVLEGGSDPRKDGCAIGY